MIKTIPRIAFPLMCSAIGSVIGSGIGNRIVRIKNNFTKQDALVISAGTMIPLAVRFTELPAIGLGCVLSACMSYFLKNDIQKTQTPMPTSPKVNTETVIASFDALFNRTNTDDITETERQTIAFNDLEIHTNDPRISADTKLKTIETIFKNFKNKNNQSFSTSEIWTKLLKTLSEQKDIEDNTKISLAVADGNNDTKLDISFKQLKEFMGHFQENMCQDLSNFNNKKIKKSVDNFVDNLKTNKPCFKLINHNNTHYTGLVIQKTPDNNYNISHLESCGDKRYETVKFNAGAIKKYLKTFINSGSGSENTTKYHNFFSDGMPFKIPSNEITGLINKDTFTPYTQDTNTCHHASVMNLLKFFVEKYPDS
jgi:hypothetical protein